MNEQTRYRLTGAVFLLSIGIIVLPMVFDGEGVRVKQLPELSESLPPVPSDTELGALDIPSAEVEQHRAEQALTEALIDKDGFQADDGTRIGDPSLREVDLSALDRAKQNAAESSAPDDTAATEAVADATVVASQTKTDADAVAPSAVDQGSASPRDVAPERRAPARQPTSKNDKSLAKQAIWAVQLASFASPVNATALRDKLLADGFEAWTSTARRDAVVRTRVAIGPLLDRRDAERMRDLVSGRYKVSAIVVHMEP